MSFWGGNTSPKRGEVASKMRLKFRASLDYIVTRNVDEGWHPFLETGMGKNSLRGKSHYGVMQSMKGAKIR